MGTIRLENMRFRAHVGTTEAERAAGNDVDVTVCYDCDTETPGISDCLGDAVDYSKVYDAVAWEMLVECNLVENVAHRILARLKRGFAGISNVRVVVRKHYPSVAGQMECSVVEVGG